jgi:hypothetical protein
MRPSEERATAVTPLPDGMEVCAGLRQPTTDLGVGAR